MIDLATMSWRPALSSVDIGVDDELSAAGDRMLTMLTISTCPCSPPSVGPEIQSLPLMIGIEDKTRHFSITTLILLYSAATLYC